MNIDTQVRIQFADWNGNDLVPADEIWTLPDSVPHDFFERVKQPYHKNVHYSSPLVFGFMRGAVEVLGLVEKAMTQEEANRKIAEVKQKWLGATRKYAKGKGPQKPAP